MWSGPAAPNAAVQSPPPLAGEGKERRIVARLHTDTSPMLPMEPALSEVAMKFVRLAAVLILAALTVPAAHAAEPTTDEKIRYILQGLDSAQTQNATFAQVSSAMKSSFKNMPPEAIDRMMVIMRTEYDKIFKDRMSLYIDTYKAIFTKEEIDAMYDFYKTPVGAGIVAKNAVLAKELSAASGDRVGLFYKRLMQAIITDPELNQLRKQPPKDL